MGTQRHCSSFKRFISLLLTIYLQHGIQISIAKPVPVWSEEFNYDGAPDPEVWSYDTGRGNSGWGNGELQTYTSNKQNVIVMNGSLRIIGNRNHLGHSFTSARIKTLDKVTVKYGRIEGRITIPNLSDGLWPAFWLLGNNFPSVGWPQCGEIDIFEFGNNDAIVTGSVNRRVGSAAHWWDDIAGSHATFGLFKEASRNLNNAYHNFTLNWTPSLITTYVDGNIIWQMDISPESCTDCSEFHAPHFMILNLAVGGRYTGITEDYGVTAPFPAEYAIDYIRVYANEWTELGGSYFPDSVRVVDCGCADCSSSVLDQIVTDESDSFSCRHRINKLMNFDGSEALGEREACATITSRFHATCGKSCDPSTCTPRHPPSVIDCGCGLHCDSSTLDQIALDSAGSFSCRSRIDWVMQRLQKSEQDACGQVSSEFPKVCGIGCNPKSCGIGPIEPTKTAITKDCGCGGGGGSCIDAVLDQIVQDNTGARSCRDRINFVMKGTGVDEIQACSLVANEFPNLCGNGCNPTSCDIASSKETIVGHGGIDKSPSGINTVRLEATFPIITWILVTISYQVLLFQ